MPVWLFSLFGVLSKAAIAAAMSTVTSFITERRVRKYVVYFARWLADKYPESEWPGNIAGDLERDWEKEYKEDI